MGDKVVALLAGGGYAQQVAVPAGQVLRIPDGVDLVTAASLPEVAATVYSNLIMTAQLQPGETVLIHGATGGIGTMAIQLAKAFGASVATTAGTAEKVGTAKAFLGADIAINYAEEDFPESLRAQNGGKGADVILDVVGAKYLQQNIDALADYGRLMVIGLQGGAKGGTGPRASCCGKRAADHRHGAAAAARWRRRGVIMNAVRTPCGRCWPTAGSGPSWPRRSRWTRSRAAHTGTSTPATTWARSCWSCSEHRLSAAADTIRRSIVLPGPPNNGSVGLYAVYTRLGARVCCASLPPSGSSMSIRHSLLALLQDRPRYGYQLRVEFEDRTGSSWPLNIGQVYTTLDRLERDGLVRNDGGDGEGHVIYSITAAGRAEVRDWFAAPVPRSNPPRNELAIKLALA